MAKLTQAQVEMYARAAGLSADRARIAGAVAMAESSGNTRAHNPVPPDNSYGLWQINMIGSLGPDRRSKLGISSNSALFDPAVNARAMAMISSNGANWQPWSTYTDGSYREFMATAGGAAPAGWDPLEDFWNDLLGPPERGPGSESWEENGLDDPFGLGEMPDAGIGELADAIKAMTEIAIGAAEWMGNPRSWIRVTQVGTGALLVGVGLAVMTRGTWQPAVGAAAKLRPRIPKTKPAATPKAPAAKVTT